MNFSCSSCFFGASYFFFLFLASTWKRITIEVFHQLSIEKGQKKENFFLALLWSFVICMHLIIIELSILWSCKCKDFMQPLYFEVIEVCLRLSWADKITLICCGFYCNVLSFFHCIGLTCCGFCCSCDFCYNCYDCCCRF